MKKIRSHNTFSMTANRQRHGNNFTNKKKLWIISQPDHMWKHSDWTVAAYSGKYKKQKSDESSPMNPLTNSTKNNNIQWKPKHEWNASIHCDNRNTTKRKRLNKKERIVCFFTSGYTSTTIIDEQNSSMELWDIIFRILEANLKVVVILVVVKNKENPEIGCCTLDTVTCRLRGKGGKWSNNRNCSTRFT